MKKNIVNLNAFGAVVSVDFDKTEIRVGETVILDLTNGGFAETIIDSNERYLAANKKYNDLSAKYQESWNKYLNGEVSGTELDRILEQMKSFELGRSLIHYLFSLARRLVAMYSDKIINHLNTQSIQA